MTKAAPNNVLIVGTSFQIKYPKKIAKTKPKYLSGVTKDTSDNLKDWLNHKFATPPNMPTIDNNKKSLKFGITHPCGIVKKLRIVIAKEK